jgi:TPR repeat protein
MIPRESINDLVIRIWPRLNTLSTRYALCLVNGQGVSVDLINATKYMPLQYMCEIYKLAADQDYAKAQYDQACCIRVMRESRTTMVRVL